MSQICRPKLVKSTIIIKMHCLLFNSRPNFKMIKTENSFKQTKNSVVDFYIRRKVKSTIQSYSRLKKNDNKILRHRIDISTPPIVLLTPVDKKRKTMMI